MTDRRIDLTIIDGEVWDVHQHEDGDRDGNGPFSSLLPTTTRVGGESYYVVRADGYVITVSVRALLMPQPRPAVRRSGTHR